MADETRNPVTINEGYQPKLERGYRPVMQDGRQPQPNGQERPRPPKGGSGVPPAPPVEK